MLINLVGIGKTMGAKKLYESLDFIVQPGEKLGLIGRNGIGKTTLLGIMDGTDTEYSGLIERKRGLVMASTAQEHHEVMDVPVLEYVLTNLPEYSRLKHIIDTHPDKMGDDMQLIEEYTDALSRFGELGYYDIEQRAQAELDAFQIPRELFSGPMEKLSGGQKRFVELVKVTLSDADLALIDEPTNHMDYVAKEAFINWMADTQQAVVVITHDRDVLAGVDRIVEIKDKGAVSYKGNYQAYLRQNSQSTQSGVEQYEVALRTLENLQKQLLSVKAKKAGSSKTPNPFIPLERRLQKQYNELAAQTTKPSFWIDQKSMSELKGKTVEKYEKYKARNIRLGTHGTHREHELIKVSDLSLGYSRPLFRGINFGLAVGERLQLKGRNGVGKSTLIKTILAVASGQTSGAKIYEGKLIVDDKARIGLYEQELRPEYLDMTLAAAVTSVYREHQIAVNDQRVKQMLADYLFDPVMDGKLEIKRLSGGQKARFQLIAMLCHDPNLLILDEPTNHLDLPSIEELESALDRYTGAVLYISHDSYFTDSIGGDVTEITSSLRTEAI